MPPSPAVPRRRALGLLLLTATAGCRVARHDAPLPRPSATPAPDPLPGLLTAARAREDALATAYAGAAAAASGARRELLLRTAADHRAHLAALVGPGSAAPSASPSVSSTPSPGSTSVAGPAELAREELASAAEDVRALAAAPPRVRRLLASVAASEQAHAALLASPVLPALPSPPALRPQPAEAAALQAALAGEHAAAWAYGVVAARVPARLASRARRDLAEHRAARDVLAAAVTAGGASPAAALPGYDVPAVAPAELAAGVEDRLAAAYLDLVEVTASPALLELGAAGAAACAVRAALWRGRTTAFPG
ncbi:uncharacterized protein DUF4439 [Motilibacter rhizosphaerae]|uniref:Uncharacterized protein DUF4439 n=1 Tax=Motilibacter rhizosphaerae TaxID=598652 RepID=A0A4Q7NPJ1_9ACTN|nr:DUF4439 domain-containing protein [Motilibacter rhizosphaerae]RZS86958.1 uncharacterized protein DUF4439 [Motilibacter rhizosphaerae]